MRARSVVGSAVEGGVVIDPEQERTVEIGGEIGADQYSTH